MPTVEEYIQSILTNLKDVQNADLENYDVQTYQGLLSVLKEADNALGMASDITAGRDIG